MYAKSPISSRTWLRALVLILLVAALVPANENVRADTRVINPTLPATFAWPTWWSGGLGTNDCDADVYNAYFTGDPDASVMQTWRGIQACGPRPQDTGLTGVPFSIAKLDGSGNTPTQYMFQCTELAKRYLRIAYGADIITGDGKDVATNYAATYPTKFQFFNNDGAAAVYPQEGDVVSMTSSDPAGHVAIVTELNVSETAGDGYIMLMDQNGSSDGNFRLDIDAYVVQDETIESLGYHPTDWIHPLVGVANSPTATVYTTITSVAADGTNHAWVAGHDRTGGANFQPLTWYWNGSSWIRYNPPSLGLYNMQYINDITIGQSGEAWAVGYYYSYPRNSTQAFRWNPSTLAWSRVNSDSVGTGNNYLTNIGLDGSGNVYAVGYWVEKVGTSYLNRPLIEKWDGTKFQNQNVSLPAGVSYGSLSSVSFSSTNGWAVGNVGGYAYYYEGSSWSSYALPTGMTAQSVKVISADEAWATGYYNSTFKILHYTTANGWVVDSNFTLPANSTLYSIGGDSSNNIWVVGTHLVGSQMEPYVVHRDGTTWTTISAPTYSEYTDLKDVSVVSGYMWAAGNRWVSSTPRYPVVLIK